MDYAGEEWKRQRLALAALLMGGGPHEEEAARRDKSRPPVSETTGPASRDREAGPALRPETSALEAAERQYRACKDAAPLWRTGPFPDGEGGEWDRNAAGYSDGAETASFGRNGAEESLWPEAGPRTARSPGQAEKSVPAEDTAEARRRAEPLPPGMADRAGKGDRRERARSPAVPAGRGFAKEGAEAGAEARRSGGLDAVVLPETGSRIGAAPARQAGTAEAKALSLAFQRDARRYDGGFSIY